jgi:hypothetical protein
VEAVAECSTAGPALETRAAPLTTRVPSGGAPRDRRTATTDREQALPPSALAYVGLAVSANWLASKYVVSVGFGYPSPAGVYAIGGVLVLRDWLESNDCANANEQ